MKKIATPLMLAMSLAFAGNALAQAAPAAASGLATSWIQVIRNLFSSVGHDSVDHAHF
mgnify:CR=1 FL=1